MIWFSQDLKLRDEECEKLSRVRNELESELEDLTASLFQVGSFFNAELILLYSTFKHNYKITLTHVKHI